jgi:small-conductance mechanosensitive channel
VNLILFGNSLENMLSALGLTLGLFILLWFFKRVALGRLRKLAASTSTDVDDLLIEILGSTKGVVLATAAIYAGLSLLVLPEGVARAVRSVFTVVAFLQVGIWGNAAIRGLENRLSKRTGGQDPSSAMATKSLVFVGRVLLWAFTVLLVLDNLGVNITGLVAGLGIGGIAIALALQKILGDIFASLSILLDKPFVVGDFVIVGDYLGTIDQIGLKTTRLRSLSGEQIVIANADLLDSRIRNYKRMTERRVLFSIDVTYDTTPEKMQVASRIIRAGIEGEPGTRLDRVHFKEFGAFALRFEAVYYVLSPDYNRYMDVQQSINMKILSEFNREGIGFAFPTQTIQLQSVPQPPGVATPENRRTPKTGTR